MFFLWHFLVNETLTVTPMRVCKTPIWGLRVRVHCSFVTFIFLFHVLVRRKQQTTPTPTQPLPASLPRPQVNVILTAQPNGIRNDKQPCLQGFSLTKWEGRCHSDKCIPIPKTLMIWVSPVTLTLTQIAKVIWEGDAREGFWEWVCPKREDTYIFVTAHLQFF